MADLVPVKTLLPVMGRSVAEIKELAHANLGNRALTAADLPRIKFPTGAGTTWNVPTDSGDEPAKELEVIVPAWRERRVYFARAFGEGEPGQSPDCWSDDGVTGRGLYGPGGDGGHNGACATCPLNQFESGGGPKPCRESRMMLVLPLGDGKNISGEQFLPYVLTIPPGSLQPFRQFMVRLTRPYWGVTIRLGLVATKNAAGLPYSQAVFHKGRDLTAEETAWVKAYGEAMLPQLSRDDFENA